jgi:hypothetical protein
MTTETKIIKTSAGVNSPSKVVVVTKDKTAETEDEISSVASSSFEETEHSDGGSEIDSDEEEGLSLNTQEIIDTDILFTVLKQFFISKNGRNIADILEDINTKLDRHRKSSSRRSHHHT